MNLKVIVFRFSRVLYIEGGKNSRVLYIEGGKKEITLPLSYDGVTALGRCRCRR